MKNFEEFKAAMKNEAMKHEYEAYINEKKPETAEALVDTVVGFAASKGFSISKEEVMNSIPDELKSGKVELSDDMLDGVVGGSLWKLIKRTASDIADAAKSLFSDDDDNSSSYITRMRCSECGYDLDWAGQYVGQTFDCPQCHNHTYTGIYNT